MACQRGETQSFTGTFLTIIYCQRLDDAKGKWVEELPHVLWTYRTTSRRSTKETPFLMAYEAETVIPLETRFPTLKTSLFAPECIDPL